MGLKDQILNSDDHEIKEIDVPAWGKVYIRSLTAAERNELEVRATEKKLDNFRVTLVGLSLCDENGKQLFTRQEFAKLGAKSAASVGFVFDEAVSLNKIGKQDVDELKKTGDDQDGSDSSENSAYL